WNVIKVIWGDKWDKLLAKDKTGLLQKRMEECVDGDYQAYKGKDGEYVRKHFFGKYPELLELVKDYTDEEIWALNRGGHDPKKVYCAYRKAMQHNGQPTVILAKTVKGFGMGSAGEGQNITHNKKKMSPEEIKEFRDRFQLPISDEELVNVPFYKPSEDSPEIKYLHSRRKHLGGYLPERKVKSLPLDNVPTLDSFAPLLQDTGERKISTTMAIVRILSLLLKDKEIGKRIVPITPDESRTFGMEGLFRQYGIYSSNGQLYTPEDAEQLMFYKESHSGQILEEGLTEAGAFSSWMAAGTSYCFRDFPMIPMYIFYSMFGFQRIGDLIWAASDIRARGFLVGATSGRTTLAGEGFQHNDGQSQVMASLVPNCVSYDPTFSFELAVIVQEGLKRMYKDQEDIFYYITVTNENYHHPQMPEGISDGIIKGMYLYKSTENSIVNLLGCGAILLEVIKASEYLLSEYDISSNVWSVTSFTELKREANNVERFNRLNPSKNPRLSYVQECLPSKDVPVIAATDYVRAYSDQIRSEINGDFVSLGTDGFGRSDTRLELRKFYEVDSNSIVIAVLGVLARNGKISVDVVEDAIRKFDIEPNSTDPFII
ncbi:MAG: pyruvate dehydrogenase (acetyl-transferring), homodimeric type, partial [Legionellales bacterium]|nr:pyruvate dehydrogenase (acetyl-transferring), homodimeric type [Legionellales bacterium]